MGFLQKTDSKESFLLYQVILWRIIDDSYIAVASVANNKLGKYMAWNWIRGNWYKLFEE